jgi:hypothetical protein
MNAELMQAIGGLGFSINSIITCKFTVPRLSSNKEPQEVRDALLGLKPHLLHADRSTQQCLVSFGPDREQPFVIHYDTAVQLGIVSKQSKSKHVLHEDDRKYQWDEP